MQSYLSKYTSMPTPLYFCALSIRERCQAASAVLIDTRCSSNTHWGCYVQSVTVLPHPLFRQLLYNSVGYIQLYDRYRRCTNSVNEPLCFEALKTFVSGERLMSAVRYNCLRQGLLPVRVLMYVIFKILGAKEYKHA